LTSAVIDRPSGKASIDAGEVSEESDPRARGVVIVDVGDGAEEMTRAFEKTCEAVERYLIVRFGGGDAE
jgi:myo-inositol catabolism protein IolC